MIKTNATGDTLWTKTYGGFSDDIGYSIKQAYDGGYVMVGYTASFGGGNGGLLYIIKTDDLGVLLWSKTYGGANLHRGFAIEQTADSGFIITGFTGSFGIPGGVSPDNIYLLKTDSSGNTGCTQTNPLTQEGNTTTLVSSPVTIASFTNTTVASPVTMVGSGGVITTMCSPVLAISGNEETVITVFPNPSKNIFIFSCQREMEKIEVSNLLGEKSVVSLIPAVDLSGFANGIYFYSLTMHNGSQYRGKLVKTDN